MGERQAREREGRDEGEREVRERREGGVIGGEASKKKIIQMTRSDSNYPHIAHTHCYIAACV